MLDRSELSFNSDTITAFETLIVDHWNPDYHFLTDKIDDEDYGWIYKSEKVEDEFLFFINTLYSLDYVKKHNNLNIKIEWRGK